MFPDCSLTTFAGTGLRNQIIALLLLPQVLQFLLLRPVAQLFLAFLGFIQAAEKRILPDFEAVSVHKQVERADRVGADQLDRSGHVEDVLPLRPT